MATASSAFGVPQQRTVSHTKELSYYPSTVYRAISEVSDYHEFLRLVGASTTTAKDSTGLPKTVKLKVGYPPAGIEEEWVCQCNFNKSAGMAALRSKPDGGVLETWSMQWKVSPAPPAAAGSKTKKSATVELIVELKFRSFIYDQMYAVLPANVAEKMMKSFERRVAELDQQESKERGAKLREKAKAEAERKATANKPKPTPSESKPAPRKLEVRSGKQVAGQKAA